MNLHISLAGKTVALSIFTVLYGIKTVNIAIIAYLKWIVEQSTDATAISIGTLRFFTHGTSFGTKKPKSKIHIFRNFLIFLKKRLSKRAINFF